TNSAAHIYTSKRPYKVSERKTEDPKRNGRNAERETGRISKRKRIKKKTNRGADDTTSAPAAAKAAAAATFEVDARRDPRRPRPHSNQCCQHNKQFTHSLLIRHRTGSMQLCRELPWRDKDGVGR
ncbi:hypothetical protein Trydic_g4985, partial [Trypoxylus dichotomus]